MVSLNDVASIKNCKGDARGVVFKTDADYVLRQAGPDALRAILNQLKDWEINLDYEKIAPMGWYPLSWRVLSLLAIQEVLHWDNQTIRLMGASAPKVSVIVKIFFKLFPEINKFAQQAGQYWSKHYTVGVLEVVSLNQDQKEMIARLSDFSLHPLMCCYLEGYFETAVKLTRPKEAVVNAQEISCSFKQKNNYEDFRITWTH